MRPNQGLYLFRVFNICYNEKLLYFKEVTIMFKKWYAIKGITNELFDAWNNDLRSDIL